MLLTCCLVSEDLFFFYANLLVYLLLSVNVQKFCMLDLVFKFSKFYLGPVWIDSFKLFACL